MVGYVPTTVHAHHPSPQIPARPERPPHRVPGAAVPAAPVVDRGSQAYEPTTDDPVDGFLAALRRHLDAQPATDPALDITAEDVPPADAHQETDAGARTADRAPAGEGHAAGGSDTPDLPTGPQPTAAPETPTDARHSLDEPGTTVRPEVPVEEVAAVEVVPPTRPGGVADGAEPSGRDRPSEPPAEPGRPDRAEPAEQAPRSGSEHGDRAWFLAGARAWLSRGVPAKPTGPVRPFPPRPSAADLDEGEPMPEPTYAHLDRDDLVGTFTRAVEEAGGVCRRVDGDVPDAFLDRLVAELNAWDVVVSAEPEAVALGERLAARGVDVARATPEAATRSPVGVTSAVAGIAATGSVVLDSRRAGGRLASLLPGMHLCVLPVERLVATPGDLLRTLGSDPSALPPALAIETGPSLGGDIEQILAGGTQAPTRLYVLLVDDRTPDEHHR